MKHNVRDEGVAGSNPATPTTTSRNRNPSRQPIRQSFVGRSENGSAALLRYAFGP
jgi:hypothetical protein